MNNKGQLLGRHVECSAIVDSLNEQRTERASARESTLEANIVRVRYIWQLDVPLRVIEYGRYYTISYRRHNRRMNLANDSSPSPVVSLGGPITTIRQTSRLCMLCGDFA
jgi:hypothetical protein